MEVAGDDMQQCFKSPPNAQRQPSDPFDRLPDSLLLLIFNKLADIKVLGRCCAVSKRFNSLATQVQNVVIKVDCVISGEESGISVKGKALLSHFVRFIVGSLVKSLQALQHLLGPKRSSVFTEISHHSPGEVLRNFQDVRNLKIELPGGELGIEEGVLLKWRAEFGSTLENCVILGASSMINYDKDKTGMKRDLGKQKFSRTENPRSVRDVEGGLADQDDSGNIPEAFYTNGGLKLRVVWTISSLIAASARHFLLQQIVCDHPTLESLVLTDADGQGTLCMSKKQLWDFRSKPLIASASSNRTQIPALKMKLWYAPYLQLPGGAGMRGATLVAIRPSDQSLCKESESFVSGCFEEPFNAAASVLVKRRTYLLEMNSF